MPRRKIASRKFWMAVAGVIVNLAVCLGYDVSPEVTATIGGGLFAIYIVIEGIIDMIYKKPEGGQ